MCGRYIRRSTKKIIAEHFGINSDDVPAFAVSWNIAPQTFQPVVRINRDGQREIVMMRWGLVPFWSKDERPNFSNINAKAEELEKKPAWREALKYRRALVPADAFFEWQKLDAKTKQPFAIALKDECPYAFAGLWEKWYPKSGGDPLYTFAIITTDANSVVEPMHERMPVILEPKDYGRWLEPGDPGRPPVDLLKPFPAEKMKVWKVDRAIGNAKNDRPDLIEPIP